MISNEFLGALIAFKSFEPFGSFLQERSQLVEEANDADNDDFIFSNLTDLGQNNVEVLELCARARSENWLLLDCVKLKRFRII